MLRIVINDNVATNVRKREDIERLAQTAIDHFWGVYSWTITLGRGLSELEVEMPFPFL